MKTLAPCAGAGLAAVGALCLSARAQVADPFVPVSTTSLALCPTCPPGTPPALNGEPVIVASTHNPNEVLVAWMYQPPSLTQNHFRIHYRVSTTGFRGALSPLPSVLPFPNTHPAPACEPCAVILAADPVAGRSRVTGDLFLGALFDGGTSGSRTLAIARKPLGAGDLEHDPLDPIKRIVRDIAGCLGNSHRASMAAGPWPPDLPPPVPPDAEALYFTFILDDSVIPGAVLGQHSARSIASATLGSAWECNPGSQANGYPAPIASDPIAPHVHREAGNPGVVIQSGARAGRLIVAGCRNTIGVASALPPEVTWTDEGGGPFTPAPSYQSPWADARPLNRYGDANGVMAGVRLGPGGPIPVPGDIVDQFQSAPSIAADPNNPSEVYVAFIGRSLAETLTDKIDVFIAWTNTGNADPPPAGEGPMFQGAGTSFGINQKTHRIPDSWLVVPGDPSLSTHQAEQYFPTLVIDHFGGINLLFCQTFECVGCPPPLPPSTFTVRYARWPSRAALEAGEPPVLLLLSPESGLVLAFNDYQGLTTSQCLVYAVWASRHTGESHVYVSRITLCPADADSSGAIDTLDPITFGMQFAAQQPEADVNEDGLINPQDYSDFMAAYACGACPIP